MNICSLEEFEISLAIFPPYRGVKFQVILYLNYSKVILYLNYSKVILYLNYSKVI
jgi:hypothetical protein